MVRVITRLVGVLLALAGLALAAVGVWFAAQLGGTGTATFTASPGTARPVVLPPEVLNRVDADVTVTATPGEGGRVWMALANPSDATAVLGDARHVVATGVDVRDWVLLTGEEGSAQAADVAAAELWRDQDDSDEPLSMTVEQADAPESVVIVADEGTVSTVTMTISDKTWFVEAVVAALVGLFVLVVGLVLAWPRHRRRPSRRSRRRAAAKEAAAAEATTDTEPDAAEPGTSPAEAPERDASIADTAPLERSDPGTAESDEPTPEPTDAEQPPADTHPTKEATP